MSRETNGDDCILIGESSDEKSVEEKSEKISGADVQSVEAANASSSSRSRSTSKHY